MPITSSQTLSLTPHSGGYRARFAFTFTGGRSLRRGPVWVASEEAATVRRVDMEPRVLLSMQSRDAERAVKVGIKTAFGEATLRQVQAKWLHVEDRGKAIWEVYSDMKEVAPAVLALGLNDMQLAARFNTSVREIRRVFDLWAHIANDGAAIDAYIAIEEGRP